MTAHDLAADWAWMDAGAVGFRIGRGTVVWETAAYGDGRLVRCERLVEVDDRLVVYRRYVDPDTPVAVVPFPEAVR